MSEQAPHFVSIIIPVFNDPDRLKSCLHALEEQTYPKDMYEVIAVDNGSDEPIEAVVSKFGQAQTACENEPSSYAARNKGITLAQGDILAFTDSDCIPALDWVEKGVTNLTRIPNCGLIGGRVQIFVRDEANPTMVERYECVMAFEQKHYIEQRHFSVTANLFTFKHVIETVGPFNTKIKSGGDRDLGQRIFAHGYSQAYADDVYVAHPARHSLKQLYIRHIRIAGGLYDKKQRSFLHTIAGLAWNACPPVRKTIQILGDTRARGFQQKLEFIFIAFFTNYSMALERFRLTFGKKLSKRV
jgi:glycosyltransferase involved in cell wall biosynthesis